MKHPGLLPPNCNPCYTFCYFLCSWDKKQIIMQFKSPKFIIFVCNINVQDYAVNCMHETIRQNTNQGFVVVRISTRAFSWCLNVSPTVGFLLVVLEIVCLPPISSNFTPSKSYNRRTKILNSLHKNIHLDNLDFNLFQIFYISSICFGMLRKLV